MSDQPAITEEQLAELFRPTTTSGTTWYDVLEPGPAKDLIDALVARSIQFGRVPNMAATQRLLGDEFGVTVASSTLKKHFEKAMREAANHE